ncbi:hypothetical protein V7S43_006897 [Phytophthora oleae]|uniref:Uncharacterized protein n=1 Tax=Phytophthora oleae TaxID=2107226 RepID=A0ABD3FNZ0_9STRA
MITKIQTKNLTVGLAVRIYTGGTFGETELKDELELFDRMFDTSESDNRLNVLIVCSTNYSAGLKTEFEATDVEGQKIVSNSAGHSIDGFHNIHEIILLNLSTPEQRAKFFAIQDEAHQKALENIIEKAQVQVDNKK